MKWYSLLLLTAIPASLVYLRVGTRAGYETAAYEVERREGAFEIRDYDELIMVRTALSGGSEDGSFMRLFRYISGANGTDSKIAMTTPVFMSPEGEEEFMSFVMPRKVAAKGAPLPTATEVELDTREGGRYAVHRFSGNRSEAKVRAAEKKLVQWLKTEGIEPTGETEYAGYDPPFTPPFLRRNEVLLRIAD